MRFILPPIYNLPLSLKGVSPSLRPDHQASGSHVNLSFGCITYFCHWVSAVDWA